jgi:selenium metabolism protein YedF
MENKPFVVDAVGDSCPIPVVKAKKALLAAKPSSVVDVLVDNETSVQNLLRLGSSRQVAAERIDLGNQRFTVRFTLPEASAAEEEKPSTVVTEREPVLVVSISSDKMGSGDDKLGKLLMKGFVYALTQLDPLPDSIVLYNSGAFVSCEGSDSLEDLKALEAAGIEILTCGTCLDFFEIKDKLGVGEVTNMYRIVEVLSGADRIVCP